jgi:dienelactone hydrolase
MSRLHHCLVAVAVSASAVLLSAGPTPQPRRPIVERKIQLSDHTKTLYLVTPAHARHPDVLVLYASGDGGWFGRAVDMFREIADSGYAAVGIGVHDYPPQAKQLDADALRRRVADDYRQILTEGRAALGMPAGGKVILTGWSLGGAYAVLAASDSQLSPVVAGIVAFGLPDAKETGIRVDWDPYAALGALGSLPRALIQSTGDHFTPSAEARRLTGADTATFTLHEIAARNHRFDEGMPAFRESLEQELDRIAAAATTTASTAPVKP